MGGLRVLVMLGELGVLCPLAQHLVVLLADLRLHIPRRELSRLLRSLAARAGHMRDNLRRLSLVRLLRQRPCMALCHHVIPSERLLHGLSSLPLHRLRDR